MSKMKEFSFGFFDYQLKLLKSSKKRQDYFDCIAWALSLITFNYDGGFLCI